MVEDGPYEHTLVSDTVQLKHRQHVTWAATIFSPIAAAVAVHFSMATS